MDEVRLPNSERPLPFRQCTAKSKQAGRRCRRAPIPGGFVCAIHGGKSPNAQRSAKRRLLEAADPAAATLVDLLQDDDPHIRERAARAILDRAGYGPKSSVDVSDSVRGLTLAELKAKAREILDMSDEEDPA